MARELLIWLFDLFGVSLVVVIVVVVEFFNLIVGTLVVPSRVERADIGETGRQAVRGRLS